VTVLRLWSDFGLDPFYIDDGDGFFALTASVEVAERFGLPDEVMRAVKCWDELYQDMFNGLDPGNSDWASAADHRRYLDHGRAVARLLRRHLPPDVGIEYLADESVREYY
jgi:hypothetical protein